MPGADTAFPALIRWGNCNIAVRYRRKAAKSRLNQPNCSRKQSERRWSPSKMRERKRDRRKRRQSSLRRVRVLRPMSGGRAWFSTLRRVGFTGVSRSGGTPKGRHRRNRRRRENGSNVPFGCCVFAAPERREICRRSASASVSHRIVSTDTVSDACAPLAGTVMRLSQSGKKKPEGIF